VSVFGAANLVASYRRGFPSSLQGAPFLLPTDNVALRHLLDRWFDSENIHPRVVAEFQDSALLKVFAQAGEGLFVAPETIKREIKRQYIVRVVGRPESLRERFYAITLKEKLDHSVMTAIAESAREGLFKGQS